jgi:hypothetical protein
MEIQSSYKINGEEVLSSGSVILADDEVFSMHFHDGHDKCTIEILFLRRDDEPPSTHSEIRPDDDTLRITLINWGYHGIQKTQLAILSGRAIFFSFASTPLPPTHIFHYVVTGGAT